MTTAGASFSRTDSGFTLLEILIATVVGAFVLLVINGTFFGALRVDTHTQDQVDQSLVLSRALDLVRRDLDGLMLPAAPTANPPVGTFSGQFQDTPTYTPTQEFADTRISADFYTTTGEINGWNPYAEVQVVTYFLAPATDGSNTKNFVRAVTRNLLPVQTPETDEQILLRGVATAEFDYYDGTQWDTTWDSTQTSTLPAAIRVSVTFAQANSNETAAPVSLVVPVLVTTTTGAKAAAQAATGGTSQ
jgi:prepilin-type N-terminal cleavage/methylation domain-containing protein